ncbi:M14 family zinc carboxypeptidase [Paenibacillus agaridevorans]|uniref:M14 family zinc carboxypeptidase n=1 Tax=Paenibacillus agaridevorans TaxID=171404 RepID=UPI001BE475AE|nr:M14 family zinc carboxypeptidase [Paenibacillus agaridevorans]
MVYDEKLSNKENEPIPPFWRTRLRDIEEELSQVTIGSIIGLGKSAGGREIQAVVYGDQEPYPRRANYNSACGAGDLACYKSTDKDSRKTLLIVGGIHGGELEGIAAVLNLIHALETGEDHRGKRHDELLELLRQCRLVLIPCMNPDGRARIPIDSFAGLSMNQMRYYVQGTWKNGELCNWPDCKKVHPMKDEAGFLGGYFNDDGINLMHDNFFLPMAEESRSLLRLADEERVDASVLLHGGANCTNFIVPIRYAPKYIQQVQHQFALHVKAAHDRAYIPFDVSGNWEDGAAYPPPSFNLTSALHHISGGMSMTFESNTMLNAPGAQYSYDQILDSHFILFAELIRFQLKGAGIPT